MTPDRELILKQLNSHIGQLQQQFAVKQIGLFGSYVRHQETQGSDIDILVDFLNPTFDNYMNLKFYLEDLFQTKVDLVPLDGLKPRAKAAILQEVQYA